MGLKHAHLSGRNLRASVGVRPLIPSLHSLLCVLLYWKPLLRPQPVLTVICPCASRSMPQTSVSTLHCHSFLPVNSVTVLPFATLDVTYIHIYVCSRYPNIFVYICIAFLHFSSNLEFKREWELNSLPQFSPSPILRILTLCIWESPRRTWLTCCHFRIQDLLSNETFLRSESEGEKSFKHSKWILSVS